MPSKIQIAAVLGAVAASVNAHGHLSDIHVDGTDFTAYDPSFQYQSPAPEVIEWSCPECLDNGYVDPTMYTNVDKIACHKDATAGAKVAEVKAGGQVVIQWTAWPASHVGPVIDYMAKVDDATSAKAADLKFFKIDAAGYEDDQWAATKLIANNNTWTVTVPSSIAPGDYVLRHEIIALHSAGQENGAQNYPKCINLKVSGSGTENPEGITADKLYTPTDPGIEVNIYSGDNSNYEIPGPALFSGASSGSSSSSNTSAAAPAQTSAAATSTAPAATSAAATSAAATSAAATSAAATSAAASAAATPVASADPSTGSSGALPETFTLETFISWLEKAAGSTSSKARRHSRSFRG